MRNRLVLWIALAAMPVQATASAADIAAYRELVKQDLRLASVGYRLVAANSPYCPQKERNPGWVIHDVAQYADSELAFVAFSFFEPVSVAAVVPAGPAARAGVEAGDGLRSVAGESLDWSNEAEDKPTYQRVLTVKELAKQHLNVSGKLSLVLTRGNQHIPKVIDSPLVCASDFQVDTKSKLDAGADGAMVRVTSGLMEYVIDDAELAAVVAHELSHNILAHRKKLDTQRVDRGLGRLFGKSKKAILATEIEADRLSVWLMANAGYDPKAALRFWERYGRQHGQGVFTEGTHLRWKNRVTIMQAEIDLMAKTEKRDGLLPPPLLVGG